MKAHPNKTNLKPVVSAANIAKSAAVAIPLFEEVYQDGGKS